MSVDDPGVDVDVGNDGAEDHALGDVEIYVLLALLPTRWVVVEEDDLDEKVVMCKTQCFFCDVSGDVDVGVLKVCKTNNFNE